MDLTGWYVGYATASAIVVVVVALVGWILALARRIQTQVNAIVVELGEIRATTAPIPLVGKLNDRLGGVVTRAQAARNALVGDA